MLSHDEKLGMASSRVEYLENRLLHANLMWSILANHFSEVKAYVDGDSTNTLEEIVDHCLNDLEKVSKAYD